MELIYETPNKEWRVEKQSNPEWQEVFGKDAVYYNAVKAFNNFIAYSGANLIEVLRWLVKQNIISKDEMNYQLQNGKENAQPTS